MALPDQQLTNSFLQRLSIPVLAFSGAASCFLVLGPRERVGPWWRSWRASWLPLNIKELWSELANRLPFKTGLVVSFGMLIVRFYLLALAFAAMIYAVIVMALPLIVLSPLVLFRRAPAPVRRTAEFILTPIAVGVWLLAATAAIYLLTETALDGLSDVINTMGSLI